MKKVILSLAILVATSISAFAASDNKTETKAPVCNAQTTCPGKGVCGEVKGRPGKCDKAFEGINLTAEQKNKLAELRKNREEARKNKCEGEAYCKDFKNCKGKKECTRENLTSEQKRQLKAERKAKKLEAKKKYLDGVKSILTPEQYNQFLENSYLSKSDVKSHDMKRHHKGHGRKMDGKKRGYCKDHKCDANQMARKGDRQNKSA